jgi:ribonuclease-3
MLNQLQSTLGITFKDQSLLKMAVTHRSYSKSIKSSKVGDNERLEFLGDAVLKLIMSQYLYHEYPNQSEGFMTKIRSKVISDKILSQLALSINLGHYIYFSYGEKQSGGASRESNLANTFEAILGAIYLDQGYVVTEKVFLNCYLSLKSKLDSQKIAVDYKSVLQEWSQARQLGVPIYSLIKTEGPDHEVQFYVEVSLMYESVTYATQGNSKSKKSAEQNAANALIKKLKIKL